MKTSKAKKNDWKTIGAVCILTLLVAKALSNKDERKKIANEIAIPAVKRLLTDIASGTICVAIGIDPESSIN